MCVVLGSNETLVLLLLQMLMNAKTLLTSATLMACALTLLAVTCAVVRMGTVEMDLFVMVYSRLLKILYPRS